MSPYFIRPQFIVLFVTFFILMYENLEWKMDIIRIIYLLGEDNV
jgi:hypothetical protein